MTNLIAAMALLWAAAAHGAAPLPALTIEPIVTNVYRVTSFSEVSGYGVVSANGLVVVDGGDAYLIDTPWSEADTRELLRWLSDRGLALKASLSTHSHEDRTAGIGLLNELGIPTVASSATNALLARKGQPLAANPFDTPSHWLHPGKIEAFYPGGGHTEDNLAVWVPEAKLLFGGCLVRSAADTTLGYTGEARLQEWAPSVAQLMERYPDVKIVVPGHGKIGGADLLSHTAALAGAAAEPAQPKAAPGPTD